MLISHLCGEYQGNGLPCALAVQVPPLQGKPDPFLWTLDLSSPPCPQPATTLQLPLRTLYPFPLAALTHTTTHTFSYSYAGQMSGMGLRGLNSKMPTKLFPSELRRRAAPRPWLLAASFWAPLLWAHLFWLGSFHLPLLGTLVTAWSSPLWSEITFPFGVP